MFKKIFLVSALSVSSYSYAISATQIEYDVSLLAKKVPSRIDAVTTLIDVRFADTVFLKAVMYTAQVDTDEATLKLHESALKDDIRASMCQGNWPRNVLNSGFQIIHLYLDKTGKGVILNKLNAKNCQ